MKRIILDCSDPTKSCEDCALNRFDGCVAPIRLDDCYRCKGVWKIEEVEEEGGQK